MLFGRPVLTWIVLIFLAVCVFILAKWAIPLLFGLVGVPLPANIVQVLALIIAVGCLYGGYQRG